MRVFNTLSKQKEEISPLNPPKINMYVCGPTTYNYIHLGNARPLVVFDTVRRYLSYRGYEVCYVQNFTDVDDKIINRARDEEQDALALAEHFIGEYFQDADAIGIKRADVHPQVSLHMPEIIEAVETLINKGYAYQLEGDVYFRVRNFNDYGKLSGRSLEDMLAGARVEVDERKEEAADFALWKAAKPGEPSWDSPWGPGRPGWHIECSVMSMKYLGETLDIHGGGSDLIFPHHENEIAQTEALTGKPFVKYWMHNGFITVNNEKMSKSLGNFFILRDILDKYPADVVRFYLISTHYRSQLDFDDGKLEEARRALGRLKTTLLLAAEFLQEQESLSEDLQGRALSFISSLKEIREQFIEAMDDDFNTARAMGHLFDMSHHINAYLAAAERQDPMDQMAVHRGIEVFKQLGDILGIFMAKKQEQDMLVEKVLAILTSLRQEARIEKDFSIADKIRDFMGELGIRVEDSGQGSRFRYEESPAIEILMKKLLDLRMDFKQARQFEKADKIRNNLQEAGITIEDTKEGARWKIADA